MSIADDLLQRTLELAVTIQQIPAPTFGEGSRAAFILAQFQAEGLCDVSQDELGNVYGRLPGNGLTPPLVVTAHLDTVFPQETRLETHRENGKIFGPGIGDNSLGVAGLFGLFWALRQNSSLGTDPSIDQSKTRPEERRVPSDSEGRIENRKHALRNDMSQAVARGGSKIGDVWFVANVCEEGLGNLRGMNAVIDRFGRQVTAYLVLEGMSLGQVYHRALEVERYRITVRTAGGHSWVDFGQPSAVHELAALVNRLTLIPLPAHPRTILNVGMISGGTSVNTIAAEATLELDLRSEETGALQDLVGQVSALVLAAATPDVQVELTPIGQRPGGGLSAGHPLVQLAKSCLEAQGVLPNLTIGSTDANAPLSRGLPTICLGLTTGGGAHTQQEFIYTEPLRQGLMQLVCLVEGLFTSRP